MIPTLIPDAELDRIVENFRDEPDFDIVALVAELRMVRAMFLDTMELKAEPEPVNPPVELGFYWVKPTNPTWTDQSPCLMGWEGNGWSDPGNEGCLYRPEKFHAISNLLVPPEVLP